MHHMFLFHSLLFFYIIVLLEVLMTVLSKEHRDLKIPKVCCMCQI